MIFPKNNIHINHYTGVLMQIVCTALIPNTGVLAEMGLKDKVRYKFEAE